MNPSYRPFRKEIVTQAGRRELYLYYRGRLIYKQWYRDGVKVASRLFHGGEGLTQWAT